MPCRAVACPKSGPSPGPPAADRSSEMTEELNYRLLKLLEQNPDRSQRELSRQLGISLGKVNYCLQSLVEKGWVKIQNFKNNRNKLAYAYLLTPGGIEEKARVTLRFLQRKLAEHEHIQREITELRGEIERARATRMGATPRVSGVSAPSTIEAFVDAGPLHTPTAESLEAVFREG